jgi:hypothetical protein
VNWLSIVRPVRIAIALGLLLGGLLAAGAVSAMTAGWRVQSSPNLRGGGQLVGVAATSRTNAWAVGTDFGRGATIRTLVERWNGKTWKVQKSVSRGGIESDLYGVAATSASNAWAVGEVFTEGSGHPQRPLVERWNGTAWKRQHAPNPGGPFTQLYGVAATSATNAWAVGDYSALHTVNHNALIEHWNGKAWKLQSNPNVAGRGTPGLFGVAATSGTNAWAVGTDSGGPRGRTLIEYWNGKTWTIQPSPNTPRRSSLNGVAATSATNAWAVGSYVSGHTRRTLIEHWGGKAWKVQPSANPARKSFLSGVAATSATNAWAVGYLGNGNRRTLVEHWNGKG